MNESTFCGDCGVREGDLHLDGCDMERCPACGGQRLSCDCSNEAKDTGRYPHIEYPHVCAKCGRLWPEFFMVPKEEWNRFIQPDMQKEILCWPCYDYIRKLCTTESEYSELSEPRFLFQGL